MTDVDSVSSVLAQPVVQATGEVAGKISLHFSVSHTHELQGKKIMAMQVNYFFYKLSTILPTSF